MPSDLISQLDVSEALKSRINQTHQFTELSGRPKDPSTSESPNSSSCHRYRDFVLYLPTNNLRKDQNPAFALACHIANHFNLPLIVLAVVLDDRHHVLPQSSLSSPKSQPRFKPVVMTSRRMAFTLEALSDSSLQWHEHGAGVAIRVHGPKFRCPDHLTLSSRATAVVVDEPFVHPFLSFVEKVEASCHARMVPCFRVDGNTTVPPCSVLTRKSSEKRGKKKNKVNSDDEVLWNGVPSKAWMWQKKTEHFRKDQIASAMNGEFDAPPLLNRIDNVFFFLETQITGGQQSMHGNEDDSSTSVGNGNNLENDETTEVTTSTIIQMNSATFPSSWRIADNAAPGLRPWSVSELTDLFHGRNKYASNSIKTWSMEWPGADATVPPCPQTIGTCRAGMQRWNNFVRDPKRKGLVYYAKRRTDPLKPHSSSRVSCYLNLGVISQFRLVHEVKLAQSSKVAGADKFEEEIVKWREMSYAHAFSRRNYHCAGSVPQWAIQWIEKEHRRSMNSFPPIIAGADTALVRLENGTTGNEKWDAMQKYLVNTGELHNNVRMTWGKELVHWGAKSNFTDDDDPESIKNDPTTTILQNLCYLNDRYALDGLSPPSYAGLLWCIGWSDRPGRDGGVSTKPASRYKTPASAFQQAETLLMEGGCARDGDSNLNVGINSNPRGHQTSILSNFQKQGSILNSCRSSGKKRKASSDPSTKSSSMTLNHFFKKP